MTASIGPDMDEAWAKLFKADSVGTHQLRLDPVCDLNATVTNPDSMPGLLLRIDEVAAFDPSELVGSDQVSIEFHSLDNGGCSLQLTLRQAAYREMFLLLVKDLVPRVLEQTTGLGSATVVVRRFNAWQRFLKRSAGKGLSREQQLGLYGELKTLETTLLPAVGAAAALSAWTGPARQPQDFQIGGVAIEVKTIMSSEPQTLKIDGERQLDDFGIEALVIAHHRVYRYQDSGETLVDLVSVLRRGIATQDGAVEDFDDLLLEWGYVDSHANMYESTGYSLKKTTFYRVQPGFPRLVEGDLLPGVGGVRYSITAAACARFEVDGEAVVSWFTDPPPVVDPSVTLESSQVEYKQTAWTPASEIADRQHRSGVELELKKSVIKTVVAFMNSGGGELVIGVEDASKRVTGIEVDLVSRGKNANDLDAYEQELVRLLDEHIDRGAYSQVRTRFESHESGTACHLTVRPSPSPRFGRIAPKLNEAKRPFFWIRAGNTTQMLEGKEILEYVAEHWR